jgi:hypothetical protein
MHDGTEGRTYAGKGRDTRVDGTLGIIREELRRSFHHVIYQTDPDHCMENGALSCLTWLWIAAHIHFL